MTEVYDRDNFADIEKIWESDLCLKPPLLEWRTIISLLPAQTL